MVCNRTLCVNLRKELVCPRDLHCASYIQRKEARELREDERRYSRPLRYLRCWDKKVQFETAPTVVGNC